MVAECFARRRRRFLDAMQDGVAIFPSWPVQRRNADQDQAYRPDSDLYFLTGFGEQESAAVLIKEGKQSRYILFVRPRDPEMEQWVGHRAGVEGAVRDFGADESYPIEELDARLPGLLENRGTLYHEFGRHEAHDVRILRAIEDLKAGVRNGKFGPWTLIDPRTILWPMRRTKDAGDIADLQRAADVTAAGFRAAMRAIVPGMGEGELAAVLEFEFKRRGAQRVGFETICAAGAHATVLHYITNDGVIGPDDLVLLDAGAEVDMVSADITRTFPASGRFTPIQRRVYEWVLKAQAAAIAAVKPGATYDQVHRAALEVLVDGLIDLKAVKGTRDEVIATGTYRPYFMHRIGHWLGSDVHDVGAYHVDGNSIKLEPGMVITIEPGLYFNDAPPTPKALRGIGIRIEDDVVVVKGGRRVLTGDVPKGVDEIEAFMAQPGSWWAWLHPVTVAGDEAALAGESPEPPKPAKAPAKAAAKAKAAAPAKPARGKAARAKA
jgi:Xaa-Pro aminopeptidase